MGELYRMSANFTIRQLDSIDRDASCSFGLRALEAHPQAFATLVEE